MELTVIVRHERESFWAEVGELSGCFASGRTLSELRDALAEAIGLYLWELDSAQLSVAELHVGAMAITATPPVVPGSPP